MRTLHARIAVERAHANRRGVALILFALLVFVFLGVAALTVDVGMTSLAQDQMQGAVDTAALEGVRLRDFHEYRPHSDRWRRPRVTELVQQLMDDDLHPTNGIDPTGGGSQFPDPLGPGSEGPDDRDLVRASAGPLYHVAGIGPDNSRAQIDVPDFGALSAADRYVDDPVLQFNRGNERYGDMLAGTFHVGIHGREPNDYDRIDFTRSINFGVEESWMSIGFLVRMRRTGHPTPLDEIAGVSSHGPGIPLLFGMGSTIHRTDFFNPRTQGLTARATAIAVGRPVLTIGPPPLALDGTAVPNRIGHPTRGIGWWHEIAGGTGVVRRHAVLAIEADFWRTGLEHMHDVLHDFQVNPDGHVTIEQYPGVVRDVGRLLVAPCTHAGGTETCAGTIATSVAESAEIDLSLPPYSMTAEEVTAIIDRMPVTEGLFKCYLAFYKPIDEGSSAQRRIVGYGFGMLWPTTGGHFNLGKGWIDNDVGQISPGIVAPDNASASISREAPNVSAEAWNAVLAANLEFAYPLGNTSYRWQNVAAGTLLAPALVR